MVAAFQITMKAPFFDLCCLFAFAFDGALGLLHVSPNTSGVLQFRGRATHEQVHNGKQVEFDSNSSGELGITKRKILRHFEQEFDFDLYNKYQNELSQGARGYQERKSQQHTEATYATQSHGFSAPHCDKGIAAPQPSPIADADIAVFPGGITNRVLPDFSKVIADISENSWGGGGNQIATPLALGQQALQTGMGLVQSIASAVVHIVPPLIPPPVWINMPLPCAPMVTGHNCFGAVLYPITMADFLIADMTDKVMDSYIAGFPNTYASKVGQTSDSMYKSCFSAYMSMHCSAIFPRCTTPNSRDEAIPMGGRVPLCLHLCILPLVMCPGFWVGDIIGTCQFVSVPPLCTQAFFWNLWRLPPQYRTYDEANPFPQDCPQEDDVVINDPTMYDVLASAGRSPIQEEAEQAVGDPSIMKLP